MPTVRDPAFVDALAERLSRVTPDSGRVWGTMTPHEMLCHLADSFDAMLGERHVSPGDWSPLRRRAFKWIALHTPVPWPKGIVQGPPEAFHTKPGPNDR